MRSSRNISNYLEMTIDDIISYTNSSLREEKVEGLLAIQFLKPIEGIEILKNLISKDDDPLIRETAILVLAEYSDIDLHSFLANIYRTYKERNSFVKARAIWAISRQPKSDTYEILTKAIFDESPEVRYWAIVGLVNCTEKPLPLAEFEKAISTNNHELIRLTIAWAFGMRKEINAVKILTDVLINDKNQHVRINAAWALNKINYLGAIAGLNYALKNELNSLVKREIAIALGNILDKNKLALKEMEEGLSLENAIKESVTTLTMILQRDSVYFVRRACAEALGKIQDKDSSETLIGLFAAEVNQFVRIEIAQTLGTLGDPEALPILQKAMKSHYKNVAKAAAD
ncbi:MAG: HEAT repeat domain-containing protein, partial [Candidatus Thorarchaeota archaeon]